MKTLLLILALATSIPAQTLRHDKFSGESWYQSKMIQVFRAKSGLLVFNPGKVSMMTMSSAYASLGGADRKYSILFEVDSSDWQFAGNECVIWTLADGNSKQFKCVVAGTNAYPLYRSGVAVTEGLAMRLSADEFKALFSAKELEFRVGVYEFKLKDKHIKEFKKVIL